MKLFVITLSFLALTISCAEGAKKTKKSADIPALELAEFDAKAGEWLNKEVAVEGIVDHVCKHGGKKILLVNDTGEVHVESDTRFDDALVGSEIAVKGIVEEFRVDEAYCLKKEEDHMQNHKDGTDSDEMYKKKMKQVQFFRDSMKATNSDHISYYSLKYSSHEVTKEGKKEVEVEKEKVVTENKTSE